METYNETLCYPMSWGNELYYWSIGIPLLLFAIFAAIIIFLIFFSQDFKKASKTKKVLCIAILLVSLIMPANSMVSDVLASPRYVCIENNSIKVTLVKDYLNSSVSDLWKIDSIEIPISNIRAIRAINSAGKNCIRVNGNGGFFGYTGLFKSDELGTFTMYTTSGKNRFVVETTGTTYVLGCENANDLIDRVNNILKNRENE
ncbi:MAG: PH domain-containing protein [Paludibacter sp.]|jgi:hypothetical protein|nr:PH domain-containing protein [Paludibacter sp.]